MKRAIPFSSSQIAHLTPWNKSFVRDPKALEIIVEKYKLRQKSYQATHVSSLNLFSRVNPYSYRLKLWQSTLLIVIIYQTIMIPYELAFETHVQSIWFEFLVHTLFACDTVLQFNIAIDTRNEQEQFLVDRREIAWHYMKRWFVLDLLACIPFDFINESLASPRHDRVNPLRLLTLCKSFQIPRLFFLIPIERMLVLFRMPADIAHWIRYSRYTNLLRLTAILAFSSLLAHVLTCVWHGVISTRPPTSTISYAASLYTTLLIFMGQDVDLATQREYVFAIVVMFFGYTSMAIAIGHVSNLIANFHKGQSEFQKKMRYLYLSMNRLDLPGELQTRMIAYYQMNWERYGTLNGCLTSFLPELSRNLSYEVTLLLRTNLIMCVPEFQQCSAKFIRLLVLHIKLQIYMASDYIVLRNERDEAMYFIQSGVCEVVGELTDMRENVLQILKCGEYFGDCGIRSLRKRTTHVRAQKFSELYILKEEEFLLLLKENGEDSQVIQSYSGHLGRNSRELDNVSAQALHDLLERIERLEVRCHDTFEDWKVQDVCSHNVRNGASDSIPAQLSAGTRPRHGKAHRKNSLVQSQETKMRPAYNKSKSLRLVQQDPMEFDPQKLFEKRRNRSKSVIALGMLRH